MANHPIGDITPRAGVLLKTKSEPISIEIPRTVILVIDMQNDFGAEGGMFDSRGIDISMIQRAIGPTARVLAEGRRAGIKVLYLKMASRPDLSDAGSPASSNWINHYLPLEAGKAVRAPDSAESRILIRDTWNTEILSELKPEADDMVIFKHRYSGFYETDLDAILKQMGAKYLIVTGCTTSVCVESTIRDAMFRDYSCVLLEDCTGEPLGNDLLRSNHDASLLVIQAVFGWVSNSEEFLRVLEVVPTVATKK